MSEPLKTPDDRYIVVRGRLWRAADPRLPPGRHEQLVADLMTARRDVRRALAAQDSNALKDARARVDAAKVDLGERGPTWWTDAPDENRRMAVNTPYRDWFLSLT